MKQLLFFIIILLSSCKQEPDIEPIEVSQLEIKVAKDTVKPAFVATANTYNPSILPYLEKLKNSLIHGECNSYDWNNNKHCNVGLMAQCVCNIGARELNQFWKHGIPEFTKFAAEMEELSSNYSSNSYSNLVNFYCGLTNREGPGIIRDLQKAGFTAGDIQSLEYLSDPYILSKSGIVTKGDYYADKNNFVRYLNTWIEIIKIQRT